MYMLAERSTVDVVLDHIYKKTLARVIPSSSYAHLLLT